MTPEFRYVFLPIQAIDDAGLTPVDVRVLAQMLHWARGLKSTTNRSKLAHRCRIGEEQVIQSIRRLERAGYVQIVATRISKTTGATILEVAHHFADDRIGGAR